MQEATMECLGLLFYLIIACSRMGSAAHFTLQELAHGKPTQQSGTKTYLEGATVYRGDSDLAVDGNLDIGEKQTCSRTDRIERPWWKVNLQNVYLIQEVAITTRPSGNLLREFTIEISLYEDGSGEIVDPRLCYASSQELVAGNRHVFPCSYPMMGRYVRLTKYRDGMSTSLSHCEFQVYGLETVRFFTVNPRSDRRSTSRLLDTVQTSSPLRCFDWCQNNPECTSFNMEHSSPVCELVADPVDNMDVNEAAALSWTRYVMVL